MYVNCITIIPHIGLVYFLVNYLELGAMGAGLASSTTYFLDMLLMFAFIWFGNLCSLTLVSAHWDEIFRDWKEFFELAIPTMLMYLIESIGYSGTYFFVV